MSRENVAIALAQMANICHDTVVGSAEAAKPISDKTAGFAMRAMVGAIILYDHISESGL